VVQQGGDQGAGLGDLVPVAAKLGGADRQPVVRLPGRAFSQVIRDPSGSQPLPGPADRLIPAFTRATTCPPASKIAEISS
jgi:hypothetical protein